MKMSISRRNSKRSSSVKEKVLETDSPKEEKNIPAPVSLLEGRGDEPPSVGRENRVRRGKRYLDSTKKESFEFVGEEETSDGEEKEQNLETLIETMVSLLTNSRDKLRGLQLEMQNYEGPIEQSRLGSLSGLMYVQQSRMRQVFYEIQRRFLEMKMACEAKEAAINLVEEENKTLRKSLEMISSEHGELLKIKDSRSAERKDVSTSTEVEPQEEAIVGNSDLPRPVEIFLGGRGSLEALIEKKVVEALSRLGVLKREGGGGVQTPDKEGNQSPRVTKTFAESVKRRGVRSPLSGTPARMPKEANGENGVPPSVGSTEGEGRKLCLARQARGKRPAKKPDIWVSGLVVSSSEDGGAAAIAKATGCPKEGIRCLKARRGPAGMGSLRLQCPLEVAAHVAETGGVDVGWFRASVEVLRDRPPRCYRCLEVGHVGTRCKSEVVRSRRCYRCGSTEHRVAFCREGVPRCPLCVDKGRPYKHVLGGQGCLNDIPPLIRRGGSGGGGVKAAQARAVSSAAG